MDPIRTFEDLECWRKARELRLFVSADVVAHLPKEERYELASQLRRAARSVTANIAEGYGRFHYRDNYKFCSNARRSLFEVLDHLITARDECYVTEETLCEGRRMFESAKRLINGYMNYLQRAYRESRSGSMREASPFYQAGEEELVPFPEMEEGG